MPCAVEIRKDGIYLIYDGKNTKPSEKEEMLDDVNWVRALSENITIAKGVTLRDIFIFVARNEFLSNFLEYYSSCPVPEFHNLIWSKVEQNKEVRVLTLTWIGEYYDDEKMGFTAYWSFGGTGKPSPDMDYCDPDKEIRYGVTDIEDLLDKEIVIELAEMYYHGYESNPLQIDKVFAREHNPTLLEFLDAIYYEISFYGGPKETQEFMGDLLKRGKEIEEYTEEERKEKLVSWDYEKWKKNYEQYQKAQKIIDESVANRETTSSWDDNFEKIVKPRLDEEIIMEEDDLSNLREYWLKRELRLIEDKIEDGSITGVQGFWEHFKGEKV